MNPFSLQPLKDYAFLGDGERGALIGPRGEIVWMCAPRWHDEPVFGSLVGDGVYAVTPEGDRFVSNATGPHAAHPACSARNTTSNSGSSAATSRRPLFTEP